MREVCVSRMPSTLRERELPTEQLKAYDKAFASVSNAALPLRPFDATPIVAVLT